MTPTRSVSEKWWRAVRNEYSGACQGHRLFHVEWDKLASSAGPPCRRHREIMVGRRDEAPLVPPYKFRRPNKAMALGACRSDSSLTLRVGIAGHSPTVSSSTKQPGCGEQPGCGKSFVWREESEYRRSPRDRIRFRVDHCVIIVRSSTSAGVSREDKRPSVGRSSVWHFTR